MWVHQQSSPSGDNVPVWFSGGAEEEKSSLNDYVFTCGAIFSFPNKLHSAPLKRSTEENDWAQKILFSPDFSVNSRLASSAPENATDYKGFGRRLAVSRFSISTVSSDQQDRNRKHLLFVCFFLSELPAELGLDSALLPTDFNWQVLMKTSTTVNQESRSFKTTALVSWDVLLLLLF